MGYRDTRRRPERRAPRGRRAYGGPVARPVLERRRRPRGGGGREARPWNAGQRKPSLRFADSAGGRFGYGHGAGTCSGRQRRQRRQGGEAGC